MNLKNQKRIAAEIMKVGATRIWIDPDKDVAGEVAGALTRADIRHHIATGAISVKPEKGNSRGRVRDRADRKKKGRHRGHGNRKGKAGARTPKKKAWMSRIRAIRDELRTMKENREIDKSTYRTLYRQSKGNMFTSRRHVREHMERMRK